METLQVEGEESAGEHGEEPIAPIRRVPFAACNEPEEGERDYAAKEGDDRRRSTRELGQRRGLRDGQGAEGSPKPWMSSGESERC
jgi:hypothetical protein